MKKKINVQFMIIASLAIVLTLVLVIGTFYELFKKQIFDDLEVYTHILENTATLDNAEENNYYCSAENLRITMITQDGAVLYDSSANVETMDNHLERPEVQEAIENGEGGAIRKSQTFQKSTFYYAIVMKDGNILRVAKDADNIISIFANVAPIIVQIVVVLFILCLLLSHFLT